MRHKVKGRKLKRTSSHRAALLRNLATALVKHKRIRTTLAKAKELRSYVEPLITKARKGDLNSRRLVLDVIRDRDAAKDLFGDIVTQIGDRKGGYTRVVKIGRRQGDSAEMALIELVDYNAVANEKAIARAEARTQKAEAKKEAKKNAAPPAAAEN